MKVLEAIAKLKKLEEKSEAMGMILTRGVYERDLDYRNALAVISKMKDKIDLAIQELEDKLDTEI